MKHLYRFFLFFMALLLAAGIYIAVAGAQRHQSRPLVPHGGEAFACEMGGVRHVQA